MEKHRIKIQYNKILKYKTKIDAKVNAKLNAKVCIRPEEHIVLKNRNDKV